VRRQHRHHPDRLDAHRDHQRSHRLTSAEPITVTANFFFSAVSAVVIALVAMVVTQRIIEPRLGPWGGSAFDAGEEDQTVEEQEAEARGLRFALYALVAIV